MFPSMKEADTPTKTLYNGDHNKVALWPDIPSSMSPTIKEVDGRIESFYNDVRGMIINWIYFYTIQKLYAYLYK